MIETPHAIELIRRSGRGTSVIVPHPVESPMIMHGI